MQASKQIYKANEWWKNVSLSLGTFRRLIYTDISQNMNESSLINAIDELRFIHSDFKKMRMPNEVEVMHGYLLESIAYLQMALEEKLQSRDIQYTEMLLEARNNTRKLQSNLLYMGIMERFLPNSTFTSKPTYFAQLMNHQGNDSAETSLNTAFSSFAMHVGFRVFALSLFVVACIMICQSIIPTGDLF